MTNDELKILIGRYFNGETSLDEEKLLRQLLAAKDCPDIEETDEARAVMAFSLATPDATGETYKTTTTVKQRKNIWCGGIARRQLSCCSIDNTGPSAIRFLWRMRGLRQRNKD